MDLQAGNSGVFSIYGQFTMVLFIGNVTESRVQIL